MKVSIPTIIALCISVHALGSEAPLQPHAKTSLGWERYEVLIQRNIFSKNRGRPRGEERTEKPKDSPPPPPSPESEIQLIGIVQKDGELAAFFENRKTGAVQSTKTGDSIARGKIAAITLDSVEYVLEESRSIISIGKNLEGGIATSVAVPPEAATSASKTDSGSAETNAILERMRKRRQEGLGK